MYLEAYQKATKSGLPTFQEKFDYIIKNKFWTQEKEEKINSLELFLSNLRKTANKLPFRSQREEIEKQIKETQFELDSLLHEKNELIGLTAEEYAAQRANEIFFIGMMYKDAELTHQLATYDDIGNEETFEIIKIFASFNDQFNTKTLKKIALEPVVFNAFSICEKNPFVFYGKPVIQLTMFQLDVFSNCRYFHSIISEHAEKIPEDILKDPDKLVEWANAQKAVENLMNKQRDDAEAVMVFGGKKADLEEVGLTPHQNSLSQMAQQKGGRLTMEDLIALNK